MSMKYHDTKCASLFEYLVPFVRFWGLFTSVVVCGVGADVTFHHHMMGVYIILAALVVFFLEITWAITLFLQVCSRGDSGGASCWRGVLWFDGWKKSILYSAVAAALVLRPHRLWLSTVAGVMLFLLATSYVLLAFRWWFDSSAADSGLLQAVREESYDRFDEMAEVLDDSLPTGSAPPSPGHVMLTSSPARGAAERQQLILEL